MALYLLIKQHNITGLKYLCKHEAKSFDQCLKYKGSGTYWKRHLKKHGYSVTTTCLYVTENKEDFKKYAYNKSLELDVVNSKDWANLTIEQGQGGNVFPPKYYSKTSKKMWKNPETRLKLLKHLEEQIKICQPLAAFAAKEKLTGIPKTEAHKINMRGKRPHVNQSGSKNNNSKSIITPFGEFGSIREASINIEGYTYSMIWYKLQTNDEWRYK